MSHSATAAGHDLPDDPAVAATVRAGPLRTALDAVGALVDECRLEFRGDGLYVRAADPASVALVSLTLASDGFERYLAGGELVGVDVERFADVVGMAASDQAVRLLLDAETRRLHVVVEELSYALGLLDPDAVREPPELDRASFEHSAEVVVGGSEVDRFVGAASMVADHVALGVDPEEAAFYVEAEGDTDDVSLRLPGGTLAGFEPGDAHSLFSLDYLSEMERPIPADCEVTLRLGSELPVELAFEADEGAVSVEYLLSPRLVRT